MATVTTPMTTAEFLALPDDGTQRWLVDGVVREFPREDSTTVRNRFHSIVLALVCAELINWLRQQPLPRGQVLGGEAGVRLLRDPDLTVGIDVVYISSEVVVRQTDDATLIDGVPTLAVEILSPSDTVEEVNDKLALYRRAQVPLVWVIDPYVRTVTVHAAGNQPVLFNVNQELSTEPYLPGLRVPVSRLFEQTSHGCQSFGANANG
jgi:Uma2 family endonuclease